MTPMIAGELVEAYKGGTYRQTEEAQQLTQRQREILQLLVEGNSAKEIANLLNISPRTVEFHKYNMMSKLKLKSLSALIQYAIKHGFAGGSFRIKAKPGQGTEIEVLVPLLGSPV